jgi:hypothetical protein
MFPGRLVFLDTNFFTATSAWMLRPGDKIPENAEGGGTDKIITCNCLNIRV